MLYEKSFSKLAQFVEGPDILPNEIGEWQIFDQETNVSPSDGMPWADYRHAKGFQLSLNQYQDGWLAVIYDAKGYGPGRQGNSMNAVLKADGLPTWKAAAEDVLAQFAKHDHEMLRDAPSVF
jgi:hypothetical protein